MSFIRSMSIGLGMLGLMTAMATEAAAGFYLCPSVTAKLGTASKTANLRPKTRIYTDEEKRAGVFKIFCQNSDDFRLVATAPAGGCSNLPVKFTRSDTTWALTTYQLGSSTSGTTTCRKDLTAMPEASRSVSSRNPPRQSGGGFTTD